MFVISEYTKATSKWHSEEGGDQVFDNVVSFISIDKFVQSKSNPVSYDLVLFAIADTAQPATLCQKLKSCLKNDSLILVDASYGVCFEVLILNELPNATVLSILCTADVKLIAKSEYQVLHETQSYNVRVGFSCFSLSGLCEETLLLSKIVESNKYLSLQNSRLDHIMNSLAKIRLVKYLNHTIFARSNLRNNEEGQSFGSYIWFHCIRRIALEVISITFEEFDYQNFNNNKTTAQIVPNLVHELITIAEKSNASDIWNFFRNKKNVIESLLNCYSADELKVMKVAIRSDPIFLHHTDTQYCFAHDLHSPLKMLVYQPLYLSELLTLPNVSIGFLYGIFLERTEVKILKFFRKLKIPSKLNLTDDAVSTATDEIREKNLLALQNKDGVALNELNEENIHDEFYYYDVDQIPTYSENDGDGVDGNTAQNNNNNDDTKTDVNNSDISNNIGNASKNNNNDNNNSTQREVKSEQHRKRTTVQDGNSHLSSVHTADGVKLLKSNPDRPRESIQKILEDSSRIPLQLLRPKKERYLVLPIIKWDGSQFLKTDTKLRIVESSRRHVLLEFSKQKIINPQVRPKTPSMNNASYQNYHLDTIQSASNDNTSEILSVTTSRYGHVDSTVNAKGKVEINVTSSSKKRTNDSPASRSSISNRSKTRTNRDNLIDELRGLSVSDNQNTENDVETIKSQCK